MESSTSTVVPQSPCYCGRTPLPWCMFCIAAGAATMRSHSAPAFDGPGALCHHSRGGAATLECFPCGSREDGAGKKVRDGEHAKSSDSTLPPPPPILRSQSSTRALRVFPPGTVPDSCWTSYRQGALLGSGAGGTTYQATRRGVGGGQQYAIKMIPKLKLSTPKEVEAVQREVQVLRSLQDHPRVVRLHEVHEDKHYVCLVTELCRGGDLHDAIAARGRLPEARAARVLRCILDVVRHCHSRGIMHRDIKPENFMLMDSNSLDAGEEVEMRAIDFGHAIHFKEGEQFSEVVGSLHYLAPEVIAGRYGPKADLWSCGVILYCLLCGYPPYRGSTTGAVLRNIQGPAPGSPGADCGALDLESGPWSGVSEAAKHLVRRLLDRDPARRAGVGEALLHPWLRQAAAATGMDDAQGSEAGVGPDASASESGARTGAQHGGSLAGEESGPEGGAAAAAMPPHDAGLAARGRQRRTWRFGPAGGDAAAAAPAATALTAMVGTAQAATVPAAPASAVTAGSPPVRAPIAVSAPVPVHRAALAADEALCAAETADIGPGEQEAGSAASSHLSSEAAASEDARTTATLCWAPSVQSDVSRVASADSLLPEQGEEGGEEDGVFACSMAESRSPCPPTAAAASTSGR